MMGRLQIRKIIWQ
ncbi:hypothetical protein YPPY88_3657, partial [Yersinia pestis PY-88]